MLITTIKITHSVIQSAAKNLKQLLKIFAAA